MAIPIEEECEKLRVEIEKADEEGLSLRAFELRQQLDFLMTNFPTECGGEPSEGEEEQEPPMPV